MVAILDVLINVKQTRVIFYIDTSEQASNIRSDLSWSVSMINV